MATLRNLAELLKPLSSCSANEITPSYLSPPFLGQSNMKYDWPVGYFELQLPTCTSAPKEKRSKPKLEANNNKQELTADSSLDTRREINLSHSFIHSFV